MPRTAFPLSKSHNYTLGSGWHWAIGKATANGREFRLLVAFEPAKAQYRAWLGLESGTDQAVLARLEYHPTHRGWHCHLKRGDLKDVAYGVVKQSTSRERARTCSDDSPFNVTEVDALGIACRAFNIDTNENAGGLFK